MTGSQIEARLRDYYDLLAPRYEVIYRRDDPPRQNEQEAIAAAMMRAIHGCDVLEIACGTGYWTRMIAQAARRVVAIDASAPMLSVAREKGLPPKTVDLREGDAYALDRIPGTFDAGVANFWLSHVPGVRMSEFLRGFHERLEPGAVVFMADNALVPGVGGELIARPGWKDTFKRRRLADGSTHEVLKNYYNPGQLRRLIHPWGSNLKVTEGKCFWWITYEVR